ncbi:hypothetical protein HAX54_033705 [Datura stramonium]|uniref:Uncharacterized protein n=1 Tax=Datura stramonium TaxID=4076 RepID=A0ABS8VFJ5_DATST|nr:hypothetical protein [Datura stramonium]
MSRASFPPITPNVKKLFANDYMTWWLKMHGNFLDGYLQTLVDAARLISTKIRRLYIKNVAISSHGMEIPLLHWSYHGSNAKAKDLTTHVSKKRSSQGESNRNHEDRCWKKVRPRSDKLGDAYLAVVEIHDSVDSPSRILTVLLKESITMRKVAKKVRASLSSDLQEHPTAAVSMFDGKKARSALHDKDMEAARKELSITVGERISNAMLEEDEKIEKVSSICQSLSKVKEKTEKLHTKEKDLEILLAATKKEVEEAKLGVSTAEKDFDACNDVDLLNSNDLSDLVQKKECLEAMHKDLINYKLCLY